MSISTWLRRATLATSDALCWILAAVAITALRFSFSLSALDRNAVIMYTGVTIAVQWCVGFITKQYRNRYWIGTFEEMVALAFLAVGSSVVGALSTLLYPGEFLSGAVAVSTPPLALLLMAAARTLWRAYKTLTRHSDADPEPVLVIGAGIAAQQLLRQLRLDEHARFNAVGLIDDSESKQNLRLEGVRVLGKRADLPDVARKHGVSTVVYCINNAPSNTAREYSQICDQAGLTMMTIPPVSSLLGSKIDLNDIREIDVTDLLGRRQVKTNLTEVAGYLTGKTVMVTGAGGSIGSEICRQVNALGPRELVLLDRDESALHAMQLELYGKGLLDTPDMVLCSIRDKDALRAIFAQHRPQVVFHTAALKHLPMLEQYPEEGWKTNVLGTKNLVELADEFNVETFVNISTDKAADPTSVLGRTKRVAEEIVSYYSHRSSTRLVSVRFGNVLGSRGSMLWTFRKQIDKGGPVTVTHPEVERYFMTIPEACTLVIQAGAIGRPGEVLVLDMGEPVKILDIAKGLIAKSHKDVPIVFTGMRPGEKMTEALRGRGEHDDRPFHPLISHVAVPELDPARLEEIHAKTTAKDEVLY
ncbi:nucleoside-diphosphate sugar epimerase/dehydratase [Gleimia hominis]|uniref:Nucleoside-diphosphate sugar epimerase/dehydratase n=1 Tax=Gleimia hominis TaxID=595468 RepID=A0ABU3IA05_9ACTO|nr:nucleoside-diphosphate sugar epimerase/dehydratase [Gleimia hominis]MDT3767201.1 nucleoside-diphosphate sugar epimerase/dehydratase [Gleimia hominis]